MNSIVQIIILLDLGLNLILHLIELHHIFCDAARIKDIVGIVGVLSRSNDKSERDVAAIQRDVSIIKEFHERRGSGFIEEEIEDED